MRTIVIAALLLMSLSVRAAAQTVPPPDIHVGNGLLEACQSKDDKLVLCLGYIMGVTDIFRGTVYCPPTGVTLQQTLDVVTNGLREDARERQLYSPRLLGKYLLAAWPCPSKGASK